MRKKLSAVIFALFGSVLLLFGCGDPYAKFNLSVSSTDVILYLNDNTAENNVTLSAKISGAGKGVSSDVTFTQYGSTGVNDLVEISTSSKDGGTTYFKLTAKKPGKGIVYVNSVEGNKKVAINVSVYIPVNGISFKENNKAVRFGGEVELNSYINYSPVDTNQTEINYFIFDPLAKNPVLDPSGRIIETEYAKIVNGKLISKVNYSDYPVDSNNLTYVSVYGVSTYDEKIKTENSEIFVINVVEEREVSLRANSEGNPAGVPISKNANGFYEIILGSNNNNPYIFSRDIKIKIGDDYVTDQQYRITASNQGIINPNSIFQVSNKVDEANRYNYTGEPEGYPYKTFGVTQLKNGADYFEIYVDRVGFEGIFTLTFKIQVTVKEFGSTISAVNESGISVAKGSVEVYNAYGGQSSGTSIKIGLNPTSTDFKMKVGVKNAPRINDKDGFTVTYSNGIPINPTTEISSGTTIFLKHIYNFEALQNIITDPNNPNCPYLEITYTYTLSPNTITTGFYVYTVTQKVSLIALAGVSDIDIPTTSPIRINAVSGQAVNLEGAGNEIVLASIGTQKVDLDTLIKELKAVSVNGVADNNFDIFNNKYFILDIKTDSETLFKNRIVLIPNKQAEQATIEIMLKTKNNITKYITVEFFVPVVYTQDTQNGAHIEIEDFSNSMNFIYEYERPNYVAALNADGLTVMPDLPENDYEGITIKQYNTFDKLTVAVNSSFSFSLYNYVVLNVNGTDVITQVNYSNNVTLSGNKNYFSISSKIVNGTKMHVINVGGLSTEENNPIYIIFNIVGYSASGEEVVIKKEIELTIVKPITNIQLNPVDATIYDLSSVGYFKKTQSSVNLNLNIYPLSASVINKNVAINFSLPVDSNNKSPVIFEKNGVEFLLSDFVKIVPGDDKKSCTIQAVIDNEVTKEGGKISKVNTSTETFSINELIDLIYNQKEFIVPVTATLAQYQKPLISSVANITIKYAKKVKNIIPSVTDEGIYFDARNYSGSNPQSGKTITFLVEPTIALNKTLVATIADPSVAKIVSGVDENNRLTSNYVTILPNVKAGRTSLRIAPEDGYYEENGKVKPSNYLDISVRVADGTKAFPFEVANAKDFLSIGSDIAAGDNSYYYVISKTFSLAQENFNPFGKFNGGINGIFTYNINGVEYTQQNSVNGLNITKNIIAESAANYSFALFSELGKTAEIENFILENVNIDITIKNKDYIKQINVAGLAGINYGNITNSRVEGSITVNSEQNNVNIGGLVATNYVLVESNYNIEVSSGISEHIFDSASYGIVSGQPNYSNTINSSNVNSEVKIKFTGLNANKTTSNVNIGGIIGAVYTLNKISINANGIKETKYAGYDFTNSSLTVEKDVSVFQRMESVINDLIVATVISSTDELSQPFKANVGGAVGYSNSTIISDITVAPILDGYTNIGGVIGKSDHSILENAVVEFANLGKTGNQTISIIGSNYVGGLIGYAINTNVFYSYVRSYYNSLINENYFGNLTLREDSLVTEKFIGGLVGYFENEAISDQLKNLGYTIGVHEVKLSSLESEISSDNTLLNNITANGIFNSYFNADINTLFQTLSGSVNAGGLIGGVKQNAVLNTDSQRTIIDNSYVYGQISVASSKVYNDEILKEAEPIDGSNYFYYIGQTSEYKIGNVEFDGAHYSYVANGNKLVKIEYDYTESTKEENGIEKQVVNVTYTVSEIPATFVGNQKFEIDLKEVTETETSEEPSETPITSTTKIIKTVVNTTTKTYTINSEINNEVVINSSYAAINGNQFVVIKKIFDKFISTGSYNKKFEIENIVVTDIKTDVFTYAIELDTDGNPKLDGDNNPIKSGDPLSLDRTIISESKVNKSDLTNLSTFNKFNFNIVPAVENGTYGEQYNWLLLSTTPFHDPSNPDGDLIQNTENLNNGYPVLFEYNHGSGQILFKVLPTNIKADILTEPINFSNASYIKTADDKVVLFYNEYIDGRMNKNVNKYKIVGFDENGEDKSDISQVVKISLDLPNLLKYGIIADYDKNILISSSNLNIIKVLNNGLIEVVGTGKVTLKFASKLNVTIFDTITILVINGISDFNLYKSKNIVTEENAFTNGGSIQEFIDVTSNYNLAVVNKDKNLTGYNANYVKNINMGAILKVLDDSTGGAKINGKIVETGKTYLLDSLGEFSVTGLLAGNVKITLTPFIKSQDAEFGETIEINGVTLNNCIILNNAELVKNYTFAVTAKATSLSLSKSSVSLDPSKYVDLSITVITSAFTKIADVVSSISEEVSCSIKNIKTNQIEGMFNLSNLNTGYNSSFIDIEILPQSIRFIDDAKLNIEITYNIRLSFNVQKYKELSNTETLNLNNLNYDIVFTTKSNINLSGTFTLNIVPRSVSQIKANFYPNSETSGSSENEVFDPQEQESNYIVPSRIGLLKFELLPDLNDSEFVELTISDNYKQYVNFKQKIAVMKDDENSYVVGYQDVKGNNDFLPNGKGIKLRNQSVIANSNNLYNGKFFVQVVLGEDAPVNADVTFTLTAYKTVGGEKVAIKQQDLVLTVQPLPSIELTINGQKEGLINRGGKVELTVNATNFEGEVEFSFKSGLDNLTFIKTTFDSDNNKYYLSVDLKAIAGETIIVTADAGRTINSIKEVASSSIKVQIVEYVINDVYLEGSAQNGQNYGYEVLNGTTNTLNIALNTTYNEKNTAAEAKQNVLELEASGKKQPTGFGSYVNNWYRQIATGVYEGLTSNISYGDYEFMDKTLQDLNNTHYYALKALKVSASNVLHYELKYYYDKQGYPQIYNNNIVGYTIYEKSCNINLIIKDNSTYDHPNPITNESEFMALGGMNLDGTDNGIGAITSGHYILVSDLTFTNYVPFALNISSIDGNGHVVTINKFNTEKYKNGANANVGLFETISENTVVKNLTLDVSKLLITKAQVNELVDKGTTNDDGEVVRTALINLSGISSFNFGMLAGTNAGSVTNVKIINTMPTVMDDATNKNLFVYSTLGYLNGSLVNGRIGGLVGVNSGTISNSYVGLNSAYSENTTKSSELRANIAEDFSSVETYPFVIVGGKNISGFVNQNTGLISNCYNNGVGVINRALIFAETETAGFVSDNESNGYIFNSFAQGIETKNYRANSKVYLEAKGFIGGFVYNNKGKIENAYSNVAITTNSGGSGGFVYINEAGGEIKYAYSTSPNAFNSKSHGQFTGIDSKNNYNNFGLLSSCYYLILDAEVNNNDEPATAIRGTLVTSDEVSDEDLASDSSENPFRYTGSFNGFSFASGKDSNGIWKISKNAHFGPQLITTIDYSTFSHRVLQHTTTSGSSTIYDYEYDEGCKYGQISSGQVVPTLNPLLVNSPEEFVKFIINNSKTITYNLHVTKDDGSKVDINGNTPNANSPKSTMNLFGEMSGVYYVRLINDLDFSKITLNNLVVDGKRISDITFAGVLDGNGMSMSGIQLVDLKQDDIHENFGLFSQVGVSSDQMKSIKNFDERLINTSIMNTNMTINGFGATQSVKVGAFAGSMYNTSLINVTVNGGVGVEISGRNFVGGIAGYIQNDKDVEIKNVITNNISVTANFRSQSIFESTVVNDYGVPLNGTNAIYFNSFHKNKTNIISVLGKYSYAGSIAGAIVSNNRSTSNSAGMLDNKYAGSDYYSAGTTPSGKNNEREGINNHRTDPSQNRITNLTAKGGGFIAAEQAGGLFGYVGENTHIKESQYLVGFEAEDTEAVRKTQRIMGHNYAGGIAGENYGMLEQVVVKYIDSIEKEIDNDYLQSKTNSKSINNLFSGKTDAESSSVAIGGIAGFSDYSIIIDSYSKINVVNPRAKIAGGVVGIATRMNYLSHVYATGNVYAQNVMGGLVGLYNKSGKYIISNDANKLDYEYIVTDPDGNTTKITKESKNNRLVFDFAIASNLWGDNVKTALNNNLREYYKNNTSSSGAYYNFVLRMPEVGNQQLSIKTGDNINIENATNNQYRNRNVWIGSLIGKVNNTISQDVSNKNYMILADEIAPITDVNGNILNGGKTDSLAVAIVRQVKTINTGYGKNFAFKNVISTTLNSGKITLNTFRAQDVGDTIDVDKVFNEVVAGTDGASTEAGDKILFENTIGNQFKLNTIFGKALGENSQITNANMFSSFAWDTVAMDASEIEKCGSSVWMVKEVLPEYIVGIYSNFNEIKGYSDLNNYIRTATNTKNQFYLLSKNAEDSTNFVYDIMSQSNYDGSNLISAPFEGTLIGQPYVKDGKLVNPKIIVDASISGAVFNNIKSATIMNIDFDIYISSRLIRMLNANENFFGLFARQISSSVVSNVNVNVYIINSDENIAKELEIDSPIENFGLLCGMINDCTISQLNLNVEFVKAKIGSGTSYPESVKPVTFKFAGNGATAINKNANFGLVAGYGLRSSISECNITMKNSNELKLNTALRTGNFNAGSVVGLFEESSLYKMNQNKLVNIADGGTLNNANITISDVSDTTNKIENNYGGLVGNTRNTTLNLVNFIGKLNFGENSETISAPINLGGIAGKITESKVTNASVNNYNYFAGDTAVYYSGFEKNINLKNNSKTGVINAGGIAGYVLNSLISGDMNTVLSTINASNITVNCISTNVNVGGIAGYINNKKNVNGIKNSINAGNIDVVTKVVAGETSNANIIVGGLVGDTYGGTYSNIYNLGNINVNTKNPYLIGGLFGRTIQNDAVENLNVNNFVSYGDIYLEGLTPNKNYYLGGVSGYISGSSFFESGYTLTRFYNKNLTTAGTFAFSEYLNGLGFVLSESKDTFKNAYYVYEFAPYSNSKVGVGFGGEVLVDSSNYGTATYGGIAYSDLSNVLDSALKNNSASNNFVTNRTSEYSVKVPKLNSCFNFDIIAQTLNKNIIFLGEKLNPIKVDKNLSLENKYYTLTNNAQNKEITIPETFNGMITGESRTEVTSQILKTNRNNFGVVSNLKIEAKQTSKFNGFLFENNYGTIANTVTYGTVLLNTNIPTGNVNTFVLNNHSNIVGSGSNIMFSASAVNFNPTSFSGFVTNNGNTVESGIGYIKDCYSTAGYYYSGTDYSNTLQFNPTKRAGLVVTNDGLIETSYYAGSLFKLSLNGAVAGVGSNVLVYENGAKKSGKIINSYYDVEANPTLTGAKLISNNAYQNGSVFAIQTKDITNTNFVQNGLKTDNTKSQFTNWKSAVGLSYNFGYPTINGGAKINTLTTYNYYNPITGETKTVNNLFPVYHAGQLNNLSNNNLSIYLLTNINMTSVNFGTGTVGKFTPVAFDRKSFFGAGHAILNLKVDSSDKQVGMFSSLTNNATVNNLVFYKSDIISNANDISINASSTNGIGTLAGYASNVTLSEIYVIDGKVTSKNNAFKVGGLIGVASNAQTTNVSYFYNSSNKNSNIEIEASKSSYVGGYFGKVNSNFNLKNLNFEGNVVGKTHVGGIVGYLASSSNLNNCQIANSSNITSTHQDSKFNYAWSGGVGTAIANLNDCNGYIGGIVGLMENGVVTNPKISNGTTISGQNAVGGIAGALNNNATINFSENYSLGTYSVNGICATGGVAGAMFGNSIISGYSKTSVNASVGNNSNNTNVGVGGIVGHQNGGELYNFISDSSQNIYGSRLVGGITGSTTSGTVRNVEVKSNINYVSNIDMDENNGYKSDYKVGQEKESVDWNSDFANNFNFSPDSGSKLYGYMDNIKGKTFSLEYGGNEDKTSKIPGRDNFNLYVGFVSGYNPYNQISGHSVSTSSKINNIYDQFYKYSIYVEDTHRAGKNWIKSYIRSQAFKRTFSVSYASSKNTLLFGNNTYSKGGYKDNTNTYYLFGYAAATSTGNQKSEYMYEEVASGFNTIPWRVFNNYTFPV